MGLELDGVRTGPRNGVDIGMCRAQASIVRLSYFSDDRRIRHGSL
jgi:hypothetical protein